jgi:hypothetical protein
MVSASLTVAPAAPGHGDTVTATYTVTGNDPVPPQGGVVSGSVTVGSEEFDVSTTVTLPGTPALPESFTVPTMLGLTFAATTDPRVFVALVP